MMPDLEDALVAVKWAEAQIPIVQERLLAWQRSGPYRIVVESDPQRADRELIVAVIEKPLDPLIIGDVGAIINSVRTALDLLLVAIIARYGIVPNRAPNFPIRKTAFEFDKAVQKLKAEHGLGAAEIAAIKRTKAYAGGDHLFWHIATLDNLRKHHRLLIVEPLPSSAIITWPYDVERIMVHAQDKSILYRLPAGVFHPNKGNTNMSAEIFLNESAAGVGTRPGITALRVYCARVRALILDFP